MAFVHIVTDGSASLPPGAEANHGLTIVPQNVLFGEESLRGGVDITPEAFFARLAAAAVPPRTSQASPAQFHEAYLRVLAWEVEVVSIHLPRSLSGTIDSARAAVGMLPPGAPVTVLETPWTSSALGLLATRAAQAGADGASRAEVAALVETVSARLGLIFAVDDLGYLQRGGRIGRAEALLGSMLQVKPILELRDGAVQPLERVRTTTNALRRIIERVGERLPDDGAVHLGMLSADADAEAAALATFLDSRHHPVELWIAPADPALAVHTGPGAFGVAFYADPVNHV